MTQKRKNPYQMLLEEARKFARNLKCAKRSSMFLIPRKRLGESWTLDDVAERTLAADQLGYDVLVIVTDKDLLFEYRKRIEIPWRFQ